MLTSFVSQAARTAIVTIGATAALFASTAASADTAIKPDVTTASIAVKPQRYCFGTVTTGTLITRSVCKTAAEWRAQGVEPSDYATHFRRASTGSRLVIADDAR